MPLNHTIPKRLLLAASRHPGKKPIVYDELGGSLTYNKLIISCVILSRQINALSIKPYIGCLLPNTISGLITIFACNFTHKAATILNYTFPVSTLIRCCETANLDVILASRQFLNKTGLNDLPNELATRGIHTVFLEDIASRINRISKLRGVLRFKLKRLQLERTKPTDAAVVLFTSGSESIPKAVVLSHKNLLSNCEQIFSAFPIAYNEVLFSALPHFHAFGLTAGALLPLIHGIKTVIGLSPLRHKENLQLIREHHASILLSTDTFLAQLLKVSAPTDLKSVRFVVAGAERLKEKTRELYEKLGITVFEGYGVTEAGPVVAVNVPGASKHGSVGRILPNIEFRIEPHDGIDNGGVLHIRGPNLMTSYLHDIVEDRSSLNEGWYDTGDIVSLDDDGFLMIKGRKKRFIKIAGEMISLGFIEDEIHKMSPNHQHAVIAIESESQSKPSLCIFSNDPTLSLEAIRSHYAKAHIPNIYLPRKFVFLHELPILRTGKIDYRSLLEHHST